MPLQRVEPDVPELMDRDDNDPLTLRDDLRNLRTLNRLFGGYSVLLNHLVPLVQRVDPRRPLQILDMATGSADHPIRIVTLARSLGREIHVTAIDRNPQILEHARELAGAYPAIDLCQGDMRSLPFGTGSFDIVVSSLALHHLSTPDAILVLREMYRMSTVGFIVNDLHRSYRAAWVIRGFTGLTMRNPMTLNDSYASVLRSFTPQEMSAMAAAADVRTYHVYTHAFFRLALVGEH